jgi:hypothetical protein
VHPQTFLSIPITQKCKILSCDTLVANERYLPSSLTNMIPHSIQRYIIPFDRLPTFLHLRTVKHYNRRYICTRHLQHTKQDSLHPDRNFQLRDLKTVKL